MKVNEIIRARRKELGLTLKQVADKLGVSESLISRYESNDVKNMGIDKLIPLAKVLKTTPAYLMGWEKHDTETKKTERDLMIEKYQLTPEELAEYDRIMKLSIEMNTLMFQSNNIELEVADKEEMDYELSETLKKAFISSLITKREKEKKE
jgi:DNA-binding helix-turn-helix protein